MDYHVISMEPWSMIKVDVGIEFCLVWVMWILDQNPHLINACTVFRPVW